MRVRVCVVSAYVRTCVCSCRYLARSRTSKQMGNKSMQVPWPACANHRPTKSAFTVPARVRSSQVRVRSRGAARFQANRLAFEGFALDCPAPHVTQDRVMSCNKK